MFCLETKIAARVGLGAIVAITATAQTGTSAIAQETVKWDLSLWGGPRAVTYPVEDWAKAMSERTDGNWTIKVHYGGTLGNPKDQLDNLSVGIFEAAAINPFYSPGQLPLLQVLDLPFIMPDEYGDIIDLAWETMHQDDVYGEIASWGVVPLLPGMTPQYEYMGTKRIETTEDFSGVKLSGMSADMGKVFQAFEGVPTPMPAPELYSSLERGTIDGVIYSYTYAMGAYKLYEVSPHVTRGISAGAPVFTFMANQDAWDALPKEYKQIHNDYIANDYRDSAIRHAAEADEHFEAEFEKAGVEYTNFPAEERQKLVDAAGSIWEDWASQWASRGPTKEILNFVEQTKQTIVEEK